MNNATLDMILLNRNFTMLVILLPLFTGVVFGLVVSIYALVKRRAMQGWPPAPGRVIRVDGKQRQIRGFLGRRQYVLDLEIEYIYQWNDVTYQALMTREAELPRSSTPLPEEAVGPAVARFKAEAEGLDLAVYVNPKRPDQSLMEQVEVKKDTYAVAAFAALTVLLGAACVWLVL
jgi:hypothetical protein